METHLDPHRAQVTAHAVQEQLWSALRQYHLLLQHPAGQEATGQASESWQEEASLSLLQLVLLGGLLGYSQNTMVEVCRLLEQGLGSRQPLSASREPWYQDLLSWLHTPSRQSLFQELPLPLVYQLRTSNTSEEEQSIYQRVLHTTRNACDAYNWQQWCHPLSLPRDPETGWPLSPAIHLLIQLLYP